MKKTFTIKQQTYVTRKHLSEIASQGEQWDYNRQLCPKAIRRLPKDPNFAHSIDYFVHEHRNSEQCEPHMRLFITMTDGTASADVPLDYFERLPKAYFVLYEGKSVSQLLLDEDGKPWSLRFKVKNQIVCAAVQFLIEQFKDKQINKYLKKQLTMLNALPE